jgi:hypothetical protein
MFPYETQHLFSYRATLGAPVVIGPCPNDIRLNFPLTGGEVWGPKLSGKVKSGTDFATLRTDGVILVDVRAAMESDDGALIDVAYQGVLDLGSEGYANFRQGIMPQQLKVRVAPRFRTGHPTYHWLNRLQCYAIGEADLGKQEIAYDVYAMH